MKLEDAIREAMTTGGTITTPELKGLIRIKPHMCRPFDVYMEEIDRPPTPNWNPTGADIIRVDWETLPQNDRYR